MSLRTITTLEFQELLDKEPDLPLIDVRTPAEFREVHVVGAVNLPFDQVSADGISKALGEKTDSSVYLICKAGKRSEKACHKAIECGVPDVVNVDGGTDACVACGLPVQHGKKAVSIERQVRMVAGGMVLSGAVLAMVVNPLWALLPAFVGAGLLFAGITDTCGMGMLLTKMPWNR